jgi:ABC-type lipoprotein export system ATPase subunit
MKLMVELHDEGRTILMVTHDADIATYAQRTLRMQDGLIVNEGGDHVAA